MKKFQALFLFLATFIVFGQVASAHVVVTPGEALTGERTTYSVGVPNEKDVPVTQVKLLIPAGLKSVTPFVKQGWTISVEKEGEGESAVVKSITWSGGTIGVGLRDEFRFRAQNPAAESELQWKAYETYENGVTVAWDQDPKTLDPNDESKTAGPFSVTKVTAKKDVAAAVPAAPSGTTDGTTQGLAIAALIVSFIALAAAINKKKK